jgi:DNA repair protein RadC
MAAEGGEPGFLGHRQRLRERFMAGGASALADYELLELLLAFVIPRQDTKPLAKRLIAEFGSFAAALAAEPRRLGEVTGVGERTATMLKVVQAAAHRLAQGEVVGRDAIGSWSQLMDYCQARLGHAGVEEFHVLFLDRKNNLIAAEAQQRGTVDHAPVYPREVVKRALELGATALILVHNHPSGDPTPSAADVDMTKQVVRAAQPLGIVIHDHVVIARGRHASFKALGLL